MSSTQTHRTGTARVTDLARAALVRLDTCSPGLYSLFLAVTTTALLLVLYLSVAGLDGNYIDMEVYRFGMQALWSGGDLYGPLPKTSVDLSLPFIYPPFSTLVFTPFALVSDGIAAIAAFTLSIIALAVVLHVVLGRVLPEASRRRRSTLTALALPLVVLLEPVRATLDFGQVNLWLMALVAVDCLSKNPRWPRGLLVGVAAAIKITPGGFILFFLLRKDFRAATTMVITIIGTAALGFAVAPAASVKYWTDVVLGASGMSGSSFATNQSIAGELARIGAGPVFNVITWAVLLPAVLAALVIVIRKAPPAQALVVNATGVLLFSPISWSHHWVWIVPALAVLIAQARPLALLTAAVLIPIFGVGPHTLLPADQGREASWSVLQHIVGNAYFEIGLLLLAFMAWRYSRR